MPRAAMLPYATCSNVALCHVQNVALCHVHALKLLPYATCSNVRGITEQLALEGL